MVPSKSLLADDRRSFRFKLTWNSGEHNGGSTKQSDTHSSIAAH
jgi:hypothetical protein